MSEFAQLPLACDVDLDAIASETNGFSGADLQALLSDAQLASVHELLESEDGDKPERIPVISDALLKSVASKARPSVSKAEKRRLYDIYNQFLDSKKSVAAQVSFLHTSACTHRVFFIFILGKLGLQNPSHIGCDLLGTYMHASKMDGFTHGPYGWIYRRNETI